MGMTRAEAAVVTELMEASWEFERASEKFTEAIGNSWEFGDSDPSYIYEVDKVEMELAEARRRLQDARRATTKLLRAHYKV